MDRLHDELDGRDDKQTTRFRNRSKGQPDSGTYRRRRTSASRLVQRSENSSPGRVAKNVSSGDRSSERGLAAVGEVTNQAVDEAEDGRGEDHESVFSVGN